MQWATATACDGFRECSVRAHTQAHTRTARSARENKKVYRRRMNHARKVLEVGVLRLCAPNHFCSHFCAVFDQTRTRLVCVALDIPILLLSFSHYFGSRSLLAEHSLFDRQSMFARRLARPDLEEPLVEMPQRPEGSQSPNACAPHGRRSCCPSLSNMCVAALKPVTPTCKSAPGQHEYCMRSRACWPWHKRISQSFDPVWSFGVGGDHRIQALDRGALPHLHSQCHRRHLLIPVRCESRTLHSHLVLLSYPIQAMPRDSHGLHSSAFRAFHLGAMQSLRSGIQSHLCRMSWQ